MDDFLTRLAASLRNGVTLSVTVKLAPSGGVAPDPVIPVPPPPPSGDVWQLTPVVDSAVDLAAPGGGLWFEYDKAAKFGDDYKICAVRSVPDIPLNVTPLGQFKRPNYGVRFWGFVEWPRTEVIDVWVHGSGVMHVYLGGIKLADETQTGNNRTNEYTRLQMRAGERYMVSAGTHGILAEDTVCAIHIKYGGTRDSTTNWHQFPSMLTFPPVGWKNLLRTPTPTPAPTPLPDPDWTKYQSPDLPSGLLFPPSDPWNTSIADAPVDPNSAAIIATLAAAHLHPMFGEGANGMPFNVVDTDTPGAMFEFLYKDESDTVRYPVPLGVVLEPGTDRHMICVDPGAGSLWELGMVQKRADGTWYAEAGAFWDLEQAAGPQRPAGWTSADAAGLPILPGLVRWQEVASGEIRHALRFTAPKTRKAYCSPARHWASIHTDASLPPMGCRLRLRAGFDVSGFPPMVQVILVALKTYGMLLADNGMFGLVGTPDRRWSDDERTGLGSLKRVNASDFEVVAMTGLVVG